MFGRSDAAERRFVREALLSLGAERPSLHEASRAVRDWNRVLAIAAAGSVAESIWSGVSLRGAQSEIPETARTVLREAHEGATARNALLLSEAASVQAAFAEAGIESVILKGPGLLVAHYPDIGARHVADVDILVRPADADRAVAVARTHGARPKLESDGSAVEVPPDHHHLPPLLTTGAVILEIHTAIPGATSEGPMVEGVLDRARLVHWNAVADRIPGGSRSMALLASRHQLEHGRTGGVARRYLLGVRGRGMVRLVTREAPAKLLELIFPSRPYMAWRYGVPSGSRLIPALYLWRPIRGAWRVLTGR